jgi:hypothetical protein
MCARHSLAAGAMRNLSPDMQEFIVDVVDKHGDALQGFLGRMIPVKFLESGEGRLTTALVPEAVSFLQFSYNACIVIGILATICTLVSAVAMWKFFYHRSFIKNVSDNRLEVTFEEFGDFAERIYLKEAASNSVHTKWSLPPSEFTEAEKVKYRAFLAGAAVPTELKSRFDKRRAEERLAYSIFLKCKVMMQKGEDGLFFNVVVPTVLYLIMHLMSYLAASKIADSEQ